MKRRYVFLLLMLVLSIITNASAQQLERLFYIDNTASDYSLVNDSVLEDFKRNIHSIDIIAPQVYQLDQNGDIWGSVDPRLLQLAKKHHIKVMPLIMNMDFNQQVFHEFLANPAAQQRAITTMSELCKKYNYYGLQFDFEDIYVGDRDAFTRFFQATAKKLHEEKFVISTTFIMNDATADFNDYENWLYENWSGAYDYGKLAKSSDFITLMAYDRHTSLTGPGPVAPMPWVKDLLSTVLKTVPPEKLSFGIPVYSGYWSTGVFDQDPKKIPTMYDFRSKEVEISYQEVLNLLSKFNLTLLWDKQSQSSYVMYDHNGLYEYLFVEDAKSFKWRLDLAKQYHLRGISVWQLGDEDPQIWNLLNSH